AVASRDGVGCLTAAGRRSRRTAVLPPRTRRRTGTLAPSGVQQAVGPLAVACLPARPAVVLLRPVTHPAPGPVEVAPVEPQEAEPVVRRGAAGGRPPAGGAGGGGPP